ncbi:MULTISPECIES: hypothetical protein [Cupriavidus]
MTEDQKETTFRAAVDAARMAAEYAARDRGVGSVDAAEMVVSAAVRAAEMISAGEP